MNEKKSFFFFAFFLAFLEWNCCLFGESTQEDDLIQETESNVLLTDEVLVIFNFFLLLHWLSQKEELLFDFGKRNLLNLYKVYTV